MSEDSAANAEPAGELPPEDGAPGDPADEGAAKPNSRRKKMLIILGVVLLGGITLGVGFTLLISALKPSPQESAKAPAPVTVRDPLQERLIHDLQEKNRQLEAQAKQRQELQAKPAEHPVPRDDSAQIKELKEKNERLEEQLKLSRQAVPAVSPPRPPAFGKPGSTGKVAEDCTITDKTEQLGDRLKSCVEGFNNATR